MHDDIFREAKVLTHRAQWRCAAIADDPIVIGFRDNGALSLFIGEDEVYHFTTDGAFRRGFWQGSLLKAERGRIVELTRQRHQHETVLARRDLDDADQQDHCTRMHRRFQQLGNVLANGDVTVEAEIGHALPTLDERVRRWLLDQPDTVRVADSPRLI